MPKFLELKSEVDITRLSKENYSCRQIKKKLNEEDIDVSISTICRVLNNIGIRRQALRRQALMLEKKHQNFNVNQLNVLLG